MLEYGLKGNKQYWTWLFFLTLIIAAGILFYLRQSDVGLAITGMGRDVSWGLYIAQFTFMVGVAASAVMVVLPYYVHDFKEFGKITILGEFLAIPAVIMCMLFVFVDLGQPARIANIVLYPSLQSPMFWDVIALSGYLILTVIITRVTLDAEDKAIAPPKWLKPVVLISIPWAISIHTITAFLFAGLAGRPFWMTAILAPRFLASAFSAGPALLVMLSLIIKELTGFDPGKGAFRALRLIITYAMCANVFFILVEMFTVFYGGVPDHRFHLQFLYAGLEGNASMVAWMWLSTVLAFISLLMLFTSNSRNNFRFFFITCVMVVVSIWMDKGMGLMVAGFVPTPLGEVTKYNPTIPEILITLSIWAVGLFLVTIFYKIALSVKRVIQP
jgi:Ni/Fe-hydrogenase subunit HybB-like protein